jgi:hypothetical protein
VQHPKEGTPVEVRIGVSHASREITLDTSLDVEALSKVISEALSSDDNLFTLTDDKGRAVLIPVDKLAYIEVSGDKGRKMGFTAT